MGLISAFVPQRNISSAMYISVRSTSRSSTGIFRSSLANLMRFRRVMLSRMPLVIDGVIQPALADDEDARGC